MIKVNWTHLEKSLQEKNIDIYIFMNLIFNELYGYLNRKNKITDYEELLKSEREIEEIINKKIKEYKEYFSFYAKNKDKYRVKNPTSKISKRN